VTRADFPDNDIRNVYGVCNAQEHDAETLAERYLEAAALVSMFSAFRELFVAFQVCLATGELLGFDVAWPEGSRLVE
jgi:hypothetical protein